MPGNGKVFISHAHEDNERCQPLLAALDAWGVDYWFDTQRMDAGDDLSERIQAAIATHDAFLRVCTQAAQTSFWMSKELGAFNGLQAADHKAGQPDKRRLIPLRLDAAYQFMPFELGTLYIDAVGRPQREWLEGLRRALSIAVASMPVMSAVAVIAPQTTASPSAPPVAAASNLVISSQMRILVVDPYGRGNHTTIAAAIEAAAPDDNIHIFPGLYRESVVVNKPLDIAGQGDLGEIIIESANAPALRFEAPKGRITNLVLRNSGNFNCVHLAFGRLEMEGCDITSKGGACLTVLSGANPTVRKCILHHSPGCGILVDDGGQGLFEENDLFGVTAAHGAVLINRGSRATLRTNIIHDCTTGVKIDVNSHATMEKNDIYANAGTGVWVAAQSSALLRGNEIHDNGGDGVLVDGRATLEENSIFNQKLRGIMIQRGGKAEARRNRIVQNRAYGVFIYSEAEAILEDNDLRSNSSGAIFGSSIKYERNQDK